MNASSLSGECARRRRVGLDVAAGVDMSVPSCSLRKRAWSWNRPRLQPISCTLLYFSQASWAIGERNSCVRACQKAIKDTILARSTYRRAAPPASREITCKLTRLWMARLESGRMPREISMPSFGSVDFLEFDSLLSDEEKLARKTARQFVDEKVLPIIVRHDREGTFPIELVPEMAQLGFFGANLKGYGCAEMSNVEYGVVMQEL